MGDEALMFQTTLKKKQRPTNRTKAEHVIDHGCGRSDADETHIPDEQDVDMRLS
jgi:hypothetical protein